MKPTLCVITGPVGAGKSTTSVALAALLKQRGRRVAVIDLDLVYCMARQRDGFDEPTAWLAARQGSLDLARSLFGSGIGTVILDGEFFTPGGLPLTAEMRRDWIVRTFTVTVSYDTALRRVQSDPTRGASKNATTLRWLHDNFAEAQPHLQEIGECVSAEQETPLQVAARIAASMEKDR